MNSDDPHSDDSDYSPLIRENLESWEAELKASMQGALKKAQSLTAIGSVREAQVD